MAFNILSDVVSTSMTRVFFLSLFFSCVSSSNVLISSLQGEGSHFFVGAAIGEGLVQRGHNATLLISRAFDHHTTNPKYSNLSFEIFEHRRKSLQDVRDFWKEFGALSLRESNVFVQSVVHLIDGIGDDCEDLLLDDELMRRLEDVDAIVVDMTWMCGFLIRAALERNLNHTKKIQLVTLFPYTPQPIGLFSYGSPCNHAYQPELNTGFTNRMNFLQRTTNLLQSLLIMVLAGTVTLPKFEQVAKNTGLEGVLINKMSLIDELADLHLLNFDFAIEFPFPISPNVIPIGGGLTAWPTAQLDQELEEFMTSSGDHGVIIFSLGTYFGEMTITQSGFAEKFVEVFRRLPQKVVWQLKGSLGSLDVPPNVKIMSWLPQNDLLGHPKTRVFLYQGGNNGFQEACYHGVPIVVIPLHGDQHDVAARVVARGMGKKIDKMKVNADVIYETLLDVISDAKYRTVAKEVSAIIKSRPMQARERAAFWIEHVIKYGGHYLKTPARELSLIEYFMLDVFAFLFIIAAAIIFIVVFVIRLCLSFSCRMFFGRSKAKQE